MEVTPGFKQTEVGLIPKDWDVWPLGSFCEVVAGGDLVKADYSPTDDQRHPFPIFSNALTNKGLYGYSKSHQYEGDRITVTARGDIGHAVYRSAKFCAIGRLLVLSSKHACDLRFVTEFINNFVNFAIESTGVPQLTAPQISKYAVALPPTKAEQEAIAEALSDSDALIDFLEQLLTKKRRLKQGAMQELLTGKRRLPEFSREWEVKRLDELGRWTGGMTPSMRNSDYWKSGTVPWISSGDVKSVRLTTTAFAISDYAVKQKVTTLLPAKSIVVVTRSGILRKYLPVAMNMIPMAINQDIKALLPNDHVLPEYLLHSLTCNGDRILARCLKSGTTVESIEFSWLKAFTIPIPALPEQTAIAAILSDMDAEVATLELKLDKARQIKQGMVQELLSGRIRLV